MVVRPVVRHRWPDFARIAACWACLWLLPALSPAQETIDFDRDVRPILSTHCWKCHGELRALGGLRLDQKKFAERGGGSGKNPISLAREENELLRRVRATETEGRMPPEGPPLSAEQIATLERWIAQGARWPEPKPAEARDQYGRSPPATLDAWFDRWEYTASAPFRPVYFVAIGLLVVVLLIERVKTGRLPVIQRSSRGGRRVARLSRAWYLVGFFALVTFWLVQFVRDQQARFAARQLIYATAPSSPARDSYRGMHEPFRPQHPPRLGGDYFRGNDERSEELYNGGFYRTATFHVHLADDAGNKLAWGDDFPERPHIRLEVERSPHSSPTLFAASIMDHVFLTGVQPEQLAKAEKVDFTPLVAQTAGEQWLALHPLESPAQGRLTGKLYVYKGHEGDKARRQGDASYLIGYELINEDGKIARASQIWMASVYNVSSLQWPEPGQIPADHWFDFRPIPEIEK